ncbi:MAG TPA: hypothetical protein VGC64_05750 [Pyrinomonadaceae bacterium]
MSTKLDARLSEKLKEVEKAGTNEPLSVIVNIHEDTDLEALKKAGLKIEQAYENISAVYGHIHPDALKSLTHLDAVKSVEFDGGDVRTQRKETSAGGQ